MGDRHCQGLRRDSGVRWLRPWGGCGGSSGAHSLAPGWVPTAFTGSLGSCAQAWDSRGPYTPPPPGAGDRREPTLVAQWSPRMTAPWLALGSPHFFPTPISRHHGDIFVAAVRPISSHRGNRPGCSWGLRVSLEERLPVSCCTPSSFSTSWAASTHPPLPFRNSLPLFSCPS